MKTAEEIYMQVQERECPRVNNLTLPDKWQLEAMKEYANWYAREALKNASKHFVAPWNKEIILSESNLPKH